MLDHGVVIMEDANNNNNVSHTRPSFSATQWNTWSQILGFLTFYGAVFVVKSIHILTLEIIPGRRWGNGGGRGERLSIHYGSKRPDVPVSHELESVWTSEGMSEATRAEQERVTVVRE